MYITQAITEKSENFKTLREKISSVETLFSRFQLWLEKAESSLDKCRSLAVAMDQKQFQKAKVSGNSVSKYYHFIYTGCTITMNVQAVSQDVESHIINFNKLKLAFQSVIDIVDEYHKPTFSSQLDEVTECFNTLRFNASSNAVQRWLEDKETQLGSMARVIVLPVHVSFVASSTQNYLT